MSNRSLLAVLFLVAGAIFGGAALVRTLVLADPLGYSESIALRDYLGPQLRDVDTRELKSLAVCEHRWPNSDWRETPWYATVRFKDGTSYSYVMSSTEARVSFLSMALPEQDSVDACATFYESNEIRKQAYQFVWADSLKGYVSRRFIKTAPFNDEVKQRLSLAGRAVVAAVEKHKGFVAPEHTWGLSR